MGDKLAEQPLSAANSAVGDDSQRRRARLILAIDGGGIRGVIAARVLAYVEAELGRPVAELFDLIAGTSTGGILALGLACPAVESGSGSGSGGAGAAAVTPRYSAAVLAGLYRERGSDIFSRPWWWRLRSLGGLLEERYSAKPLDGVLAEYFTGLRLADALLPVMVTGYDIAARQTLFLKSWHHQHGDVAMAAAARATSAAPSYFEPARLVVGGRVRSVIDGGVVANSPSVSAYAEALVRFPGERIRVLSLGSGELTQPLPLRQAKGWGALGWVAPLLDCLLDGSAKAADYQMRLFLKADYLRLQVRLDGASDALDDASATNITALEGVAEQLIAAQGPALLAWLREQ